MNSIINNLTQYDLISFFFSFFYLSIRLSGLLGFSRQMEPVGYIHTWILYICLLSVYLYKGTYHKKSAGAIMASEKSYNLLSASWRTRKPVVQVIGQVWRPGNQENQRYKISLIPKAWEAGVLRG